MSASVSAAVALVYMIMLGENYIAAFIVIKIKVLNQVLAH